MSFAIHRKIIQVCFTNKTTCSLLYLLQAPNNSDEIDRLVVIGVLSWFSFIGFFVLRKALFLDFVRPVRGTSHGRPPQGFCCYRPFGAPKASIWDFGMIHVCVIELIFFEFTWQHISGLLLYFCSIVHLSSVVPVSTPCNYVYC